LSQIAFLAERRPHLIWSRAREAVSFNRLSSCGRARSDFASPLALALTFWALSYILFTLRAFTISSDAPTLSAIRFSTTAVGALLVGLFLAQVDQKTIARNANILRILLVTVGASLIVWTARNLYAIFAPEPFTSIADNARWAMFWAGYCASFLSLYLLHLAKRGQMLQSEAAMSAFHSPVTEREAALSLLVDALADELREKGHELDDAFFDRVTHDLLIGMVVPQGTATRATPNAAGEIIDRLRGHFSAPSSRRADQPSTRGQRLVA
jgi:hypothetical protein